MPALPARSRPLAWWAGALVAGVAGVAVARGVDTQALAATWAALRAAPMGLLLILGLYSTAFLLRALAWTRTIPALGLGHAVAAIHLSVGANHVLPLRLGEALRVTSVVRRAGIGLSAATASTVVLRAADVVAVLAIGVALAPGVGLEMVGEWWPLAVAVGVGAAALGGVWLGRLRRAGQRLVLPGALTLALVVVSWLLEAVVIWQMARWADAPVTVSVAVLVTAVTIAAQVAAVAPGGFGTYEAAATAALVAVGIAPGTALAVALGAHAVKTAYALVTGGLAAVVPAPSLLGRIRLPGRPAVQPATPAVDPDPSRPVVLFLPAHDEEASVGQVVARVPSRVAGHPVRCLVVDDGSTDRTRERAALAGAEVVSLPDNQGLGAAVRRGLTEAVARDAAAVAFCDADGEYDPEQLADLVRPVLRGQADYVVGSRFAGDIHRMLPHRRLGNLALTAALRFVTRAPVTDGQSGYRALSPRAAAAAEVAHDFNYAQVLTIDLLAKGFGYAEVAITYRFRETGRSFVRLGRYLTTVVPAVWRMLNRELPYPRDLAPGELSSARPTP